MHTYNLSAHADSTGLKSIVDQVRPHADHAGPSASPGPAALFRHRLSAAGYAVTDNRAPWDAQTVIADARAARSRHSSRSRGSRRRARWLLGRYQAGSPAWHPAMRSWLHGARPPEESAGRLRAHGASRRRPRGKDTDGDHDRRPIRPQPPTLLAAVHAAALRLPGFPSLSPEAAQAP